MKQNICYCEGPTKKISPYTSSVTKKWVDRHIIQSPLRYDEQCTWIKVVMSSWDLSKPANTPVSHTANPFQLTSCEKMVEKNYDYIYTLYGCNKMLRQWNILPITPSCLIVDDHLWRRQLTMRSGRVRKACANIFSTLFFLMLLLLI